MLGWQTLLPGPATPRPPLSALQSGAPPCEQLLGVTGLRVFRSQTWKPSPPSRITWGLVTLRKLCVPFCMKQSAPGPQP